MMDFFAMGGYAFYVWMSYVLTFVVLLANFVLPLRRERELLRILARKFRRQAHVIHHSNGEA